MKRTKQFPITRKQNYFILIISVFLFVSCSPATSTNLSTSIATKDGTQSDIPTQVAQEVISQNSTAVFTPAETNTPQLVETPTNTPSLPSSSPHPTIVVSTPTLIPTLTDEQKVDNFTELMRDNGGCELPCWWGIIPGESKIEPIAEQFVPQGFIWWEEWNQLEGLSSGSAIMATFSLEESIIQSIEVWGGKEDSRFSKDWENYSLDQILTHYGIPSDVFVYYPYRPDPGSSPSYSLSIFYEELGFTINYAGKATDIDNGKSRACPKLDEVSLIRLFLYQPMKVNNVIETVIPPETVSFIAEPETVYDLMSWEQATDTTLESFYEQFSQPDFDGCFDFKRYWTSP